MDRLLFDAARKEIVIETISSLSTALFAVTFLVIVSEVKKRNFRYVESAIRNPLWPRTKLTTIYDFYRIYYDSKGANIIIVLNLICFVITVLGLIIIISDH